MSMLSFDEFVKSTLIVMTTFNRKDITEICVKNIHEHKRDASLWIVDDHSTEYDINWLQSIAPNATIVQFTEKLGIEKLRYNIQVETLKTEYKFVYHTDNDAFHDPLWLVRLYELYYHNVPVLGLYNTNHHFKHTVKEYSNYILRSACAGISFWIEQEKIKSLPTEFNDSWDYEFCNMLGKRAVVSEVSFVEHFGGGGIHNRDFERDRAYNPTTFLKNERPRILKLLGVDS